jgi:hypothetical protein
MDAQQILDALEGLACPLLHDSSRTHSADSLQGFERSRTRAIQLDGKAEEPASGPTDLPPARLWGLATNGHRMLLDSRRLDGMSTQYRFGRGSGKRQHKERTAQRESRQGLSLLHLEAFTGGG